MQKEVFIYITLLLLIIIPSAYAVDEKEIYSGTIYSNQISTVNITNEIFSFSLSSAHDKVVITLPTNSYVVVKNGSCETTENYELCVTNSEFWYHNTTLDDDIYKASIKIYSFLLETTEIELTRTVETTEFLIGEQTKIMVTLKNTGNVEATNIIYSDPIPNSFAITQISDCVAYANSTHKTIKWYGSLNGGIEKRCSYKIKALQNITFKSQASISYNNGVKQVQSNSKISTITVPDYQLNMILTLDKNEVKLNQETNLNINLTNINNNNSITITTFKIIIPEGLDISAPPKYLIQDYKELSWKGSLDKGETKLFNIKLKSRYIENYTLKPRASFIINNIRKEVEKSISLNSYEKTLSINSMVDKEVLSSEKSHISVEIKNPSQTYSFNDIDIVIESDMPNFIKITEKIGNLKPLESKKIEDIYFTAPEVVDKKNYSINLRIIYKSEYNQILEANQEKILTVIGKKEVVSPVINETSITKKEADNPPAKLNISLKELFKSGKYNFSIRSLIIPLGIFFIFVLLSALFMGYKRGHPRRSY
ncbi:MAG: DUF11 domain-containing protein [Nanoarchaeota archaeon]|nr:DUF11 domain-containing protein [Nanoarchaeota archaeon]